MLKPGYPLTLTIWVKVAYPFKQNSQISQNFAFSVQINAPAWKNKFTTASGGQTWDLSKNLHIVFWRNLHKWQKFLHDRRSQQISTLVVAVVTIMGCGDEQSTDLEIVSLCFVVKAQRQLTKMLNNSDDDQSTDRPPTGIRRRHRQLRSSQPELPIFLVSVFLQFELSGLFYSEKFSISIVFFVVIFKFLLMPQNTLTIFAKNLVTTRCHILCSMRLHCVSKTLTPCRMH